MSGFFCFPEPGLIISTTTVYHGQQSIKKTDKQNDGASPNNLLKIKMS